MRLEAQNDYLNKERNKLEGVIQRMKDEDRTKESLRKEIGILREQRDKLSLKIEDYEQMV